MNKKVGVEEEETSVMSMDVMSESMTAQLLPPPHQPFSQSLSQSQGRGQEQPPSSPLLSFYEDDTSHHEPRGSREWPPSLAPPRATRKEKSHQRDCSRVNKEGRQSELLGRFG